MQWWWGGGGGRVLHPTAGEGSGLRGGEWADSFADAEIFPEPAGAETALKAAQRFVADRIVVTKTDLAEPDTVAALEAELLRLNPQAPIMSVVLPRRRNPPVLARRVARKS